MKIKINKTFISVIAMFISFLGGVGSSMASDNYRYSTFVPSTHVISTEVVKPFIDRVREETGGDISYKQYDGGVLIGAKNMAEGLRDGVSDLGVVVFSYYPAKFPHNSFLSEMGVYGSYSPAVTAAITEMLLLHCELCIEDMKHNKVVILGVATVPPNQLLSKRDLSDLNDLKGMKVRTSSAIADRWLRSVGAVPVAMSSAEQYEALSRGQIDAIMSPEYQLKSHSIWDIAKSVTQIDLVMNPSLAAVAASQKHWQNDLSAEQRAIMLKQAARAQIDMAFGPIDENNEVLSMAQDKGLKYYQPKANLKSQISSFTRSEYATVLEKGKSTYHIEDPEPAMDMYISLVDKWEKLYAPIAGDKDKMTAILYDEVYSKLEPDTFGVWADN